MATAQSVLRVVVDRLNDAGSVRWTVPELVRHFNDAQRAVVELRPDATAVEVTLTLVAGARQTLPSTAYRLLEIPRNAAGALRAIRMVNRALLDAHDQDWYSLPGVTEFQHYTYDPREPRAFFVYPPAAAGATLVALVSQYPTDIAVPAGLTPPLTDVAGSMSLADQFANAVQEFVLSRAFGNDAEVAANADRAQAHLALFQAAAKAA